MPAFLSVARYLACYVMVLGYARHSFLALLCFVDLFSHYIFQGEAISDIVYHSDKALHPFIVTSTNLYTLDISRGELSKLTTY